MVAAADAYARGKPPPSAPPSLRLYRLGRELPGLLSSIDLLAEPYELMRELECYAEALNAERGRQAARQKRAGKRGR